MSFSFWQETDSPATFQNDVTHWWDGSQLYGSDVDTSANLRSFKDGKMKVNEKDGLLPLDPKTGIDKTGKYEVYSWIQMNSEHNIITFNIIQYKLMSERITGLKC